MATTKLADSPAALATRDLKNKPLLEAIFEVRWRLPDAAVDPLAKLLPGLFFSKLNSEYPFHEQLPQASLPDEVTVHTPQHRFRHGKAQWPLFQLGPGLLTLNDTAGYQWPNFRSRAESLVKLLFEVHPMRDSLKIESLTLRYIDAVAFDARKDDAYAFLKEKMKVTLQLPPSLFSDNLVCSKPETFTWQSSFPCERPAGRVILSFGTQYSDGKPRLTWDTQVFSKDADAPSIPEQFAVWLDGAHSITHDWFFKLIEGDLEKQFDA